MVHHLPIKYEALNSHPEFSTKEKIMILMDGFMEG
jgi:hypothetical protein